MCDVILTDIPQGSRRGGSYVFSIFYVIYFDFFPDNCIVLLLNKSD